MGSLAAFTAGSVCLPLENVCPLLNVCIGRVVAAQARRRVAQSDDSLILGRE
jgi:hypothetical protein